MIFILTILTGMLLSLNLFSQSNTITYQSKLLDNNGIPLNQNGITMTFAIYDAATNGNKLWPTSGTVSKTVDVVSGLYSVTLGTGVGSDEVFTSSDLDGVTPYLEVSVNSTILPRVPISSVPISILSNNLSAAAWASPPAIGTTTPNAGTFSTLTVNTGSNSYSLPSTCGSDGQVLTSNGIGGSTWTAGMTVPSGAVANDLLSFDGTNWVAKNLVVQSTGGNQPFNNMQPYLVVNYSIALEGVFPSRNIADPLLGTIGIFGFNFAPSFWAQCDGQLLAIAEYDALFALIGTIYGGDGQTTFAIPDLRGRVPVNQGQGPGLSYRVIGETGGTETSTLIINNLPAHTHTIIYQ